MTMQTWKPRLVRFLLISTSVLALVGCAERLALGPEAVQGKTPDGTIEMHEVQAAYIGSGSGGNGVLFFRGGEYPFEVGGLGVGGIGVSTIEATGEVYNLRDLGQFPGTYGQARYGFAIGDASAGDLWMQNEAGVILHLKAKRTGLMLSLGGMRSSSRCASERGVVWQRGRVDVSGGSRPPCVGGRPDGGAEECGTGPCRDHEGQWALEL